MESNYEQLRSEYVFCLHLFQGKEVIEYYINELLSQGITEIPRWKSPVKAVKPPDDVPSQDSGVRSRSNSVTSQHSHSSQSSLVLGATAATIHTEGKSRTNCQGQARSFYPNVLKYWNRKQSCLTMVHVGPE